MNTKFSNIEIVTIAVYLLGGDSSYVDTEDVAVKSNELAPGRFTWRKYPDQINIDNIRKRLSDAKNPKKGGYLLGSFKQGWLLSETGLKFSKGRFKELKGIDLSRAPLNKKEMAWQSSEKTRMLGSLAFQKVSSNNSSAVTTQEAESFFRIDDYIMGDARRKKLARIVNTFADDPELGWVVKLLASKVATK